MTVPTHGAFPSLPMAQDGLTKVEYFAAAALTGLCANPEMFDADADEIADKAHEAALAMVDRLNGVRRPSSEDAFESETVGEIGDPSPSVEIDCDLD